MSRFDGNGSAEPEREFPPLSRPPEDADGPVALAVVDSFAIS